MEAFQQRFRRLQCKTTGVAVPGQTPAGHAGERVQEPKIVGVGVLASGDTQPEGANVLFRHLAEGCVPAHLPCQPQLSGPETGGPFDVIGQRVVALNAGLCRETLTERR